MSRGRPKGESGSTVTVHLDPEMAQQLDQWQNNFGLDSRSATALAMMRAGTSAVPLDTAIFEISQASVREHRKFFAEKLAEFFEAQVNMLRGNRG